MNEWMEVVYLAQVSKLLQFYLQVYGVFRSTFLSIHSNFTYSSSLCSKYIFWALSYPTPLPSRLVLFVIGHWRPVRLNIDNTTSP